jgi:hypothetical protein
LFESLPRCGGWGDFQFRAGGSLAGVLFEFGGTSIDRTVGNFFHPATFGALYCFDLWRVRDAEPELPDCRSVPECSSGFISAACLVLPLSVRGRPDGVLSSEISPLDGASLTGVWVRWRNNVRNVSLAKSKRLAVGRAVMGSFVAPCRSAAEPGCECASATVPRSRPTSRINSRRGRAGLLGFVLL